MTNPDTHRILNAVENNTRANIIADIVGHPHTTPTYEEIEHMNPSIEPDELSEHLRTLADTGLIKIIESDQHTFYALTKKARSVFDDNNLFDRDSYRAAYEEVSKPPEIQQLETLDRPADVRDAALTHTNDTAEEDPDRYGGYDKEEELKHAELPPDREPRNS